MAAPLAHDVASYEATQLVERVTDCRLTRIMAPAPYSPQDSVLAVYQREQPRRVVAVEFYETEREGPPERLSLSGAAWRALVSTCRKLETAHKRLGEKQTEEAA
jgi:hypothetical protein